MLPFSPTFPLSLSRSYTFSGSHSVISIIKNQHEASTQPTWGENYSEWEWAQREWKLNKLEVLRCVQAQRVKQTGPRWGHEQAQRPSRHWLTAASTDTKHFPETQVQITSTSRDASAYNKHWDNTYQTSKIPVLQGIQSQATSIKATSSRLITSTQRTMSRCRAYYCMQDYNEREPINDCNQTPFVFWFESHWLASREYPVHPCFYFFSFFKSDWNKLCK